jgi:hypothetical protein
MNHLLQGFLPLPPGARCVLSPTVTMTDLAFSNQRCSTEGKL